MTASNAWCCLPLLLGLSAVAASTDTAPVLQIESTVLAPVEPHVANQHVIWYDNFDEDRIASYLEPKAGSPQARRSESEALGGVGQSMECLYAKGEQGVGNRKLVFGDSPIGGVEALQRGLGIYDLRVLR